MRRLTTIDEIAKLISDGIDVQDLSTILFSLIMNAEKLNMSGITKKETVIFALNLVRGRVPDDKKDEFDWIVNHAPQLIDNVITLANSTLFKKFKKRKFRFC